MNNNPCRCGAYPYPHRTGGGACIECGCADAPLCRHWIATADPFCTGDHNQITYERAPNAEIEPTQGHKENSDG